MQYIYSGDSISLFHNGKPYIYQREHRDFEKIVSLIKQKDETGIKNLLNVKTEKGLRFTEDQVYFNGELVDTFTTKMYFLMKENGFDTKPLELYLENCYKNPFPEIVNKLYEFLSSRGMALTEDGCFIGYKYCNNDYYDSHTGRTVRYKPNTRVEWPNRENICDTGGQECSDKGYHVGNYEYSANPGGNRRVVLVKVNPKDVLSVPHGSEAKKIRVWAMDVLDEVPRGTEIEDPVRASNGEKVRFRLNHKVKFDYKTKRREANIEGIIVKFSDRYLFVKVSKYGNKIILSQNQVVDRFDVANVSNDVLSELVQIK